jgi:hypothetical protein
MKWMMRSTRAKPTDPCLAPAIGALAGTGILKPLAIAEGFPENCGQGVQGKSKNTAIANETSATMPGADAAAVGDGPVADARPDQIRLPVMLAHCELRVHPIIIAGSSERYCSFLLP